MSNQVLSADEIAAAREWLAECQWPDCEPELFRSLDPELIVKGVALHYDGGIAGFKHDFRNEVAA